MPLTEGRVTLSFGPGDIAPGEPADKVAAALARFRCETATTEAAFDQGYRLLDAQFGPLNELERREVLDRWFHRGSLSPPDAAIRAHYHLTTVFDRDGRVAAVRDGFSAVDAGAGRVVELMSHSLVLPEWRRTGVAALLRAAPVVYARDHGPPGAELTVVAEMEMVEPDAADSKIRLVAYGRAGFRVIDPAVMTYAQPDFRDVEALGIPAVPLPFLLVVRMVGEESADHIAAARATAIVDHLGAVHRPSVAAAQMDEIRAVALHRFDPSGADLPMLPLPRSIDDAERFAPLQRDRLIHRYPAAWHGVKP